MLIKAEGGHSLVQPLLCRLPALVTAEPICRCVTFPKSRQSTKQVFRFNSVKRTSLSSRPVAGRKFSESNRAFKFAWKTNPVFQPGSVKKAAHEANKQSL